MHYVFLYSHSFEFPHIFLNDSSVIQIYENITYKHAKPTSANKLLALSLFNLQLPTHVRIHIMQQKRFKATAETHGLQTPVHVINLISRHYTRHGNDLDVTRQWNHFKSEVRDGAQLRPTQFHDTAWVKCNSPTYDETKLGRNFAKTISVSVSHTSLFCSIESYEHTFNLTHTISLIIFYST